MMQMQGMASVEVSGPSGQTNVVLDRNNTNTETTNMTMHDRLVI